METTLFTGDGCPNCTICKDIIKEKSLPIFTVHIDPETRVGRDIQMNNRVMSIPTLMITENGKELNRYVGNDAIDYLSTL